LLRTKYPTAKTALFQQIWQEDWTVFSYDAYGHSGIEHFINPEAISGFEGVLAEAISWAGKCGLCVEENEPFVDRVTL
jgi:hypothetical protein